MGISSPGLEAGCVRGGVWPVTFCTGRLTSSKSSTCSLENLFELQRRHCNGLGGAAWVIGFTKVGLHTEHRTSTLLPPPAWPSTSPSPAEPPGPETVSRAQPLILVHQEACLLPLLGFQATRAAPVIHFFRVRNNPHPRFYQLDCPCSPSF